MSTGAVARPGSASSVRSIGDRGFSRQTSSSEAEQLVDKAISKAGIFTQQGIVSVDATKHLISQNLSRVQDKMSVLHDMGNVLEEQMNDGDINEEKYRTVFTAIEKVMDEITAEPSSSIPFMAMDPNMMPNITLVSEKDVYAEIKEVENEGNDAENVYGNSPAVGAERTRDLQKRGSKLQAKVNHLEKLIPVARKDLAGALSSDPEDIKSDTPLNRIFAVKSRTCANISSSCSIALSKEQISKNRYRNILAPNHTRVVLQNVPPGDPGYINANEVGVAAPFIASQAPLDEHRADHWQMIWEQNIPSVEVLTKDVEKSKRKMTQYWPSADEKPQTYGPFVVDCKESYDIGGGTLSKIHIHNTETNEDRDVVIGRYENWPDFGVIPQDKIPEFLEFHRGLQDFSQYTQEQLHQQNPSAQHQPGLPLIHCSAGMGRTGAVGLAENLTQSMIKNPFKSWEGESTVSAALHTYRNQRSNNFVQTRPQLQLAMNMALENLEIELAEARRELSSVKYELFSRMDFG